MSTDVIGGRTRAIVWDYFERIIGDDGLQKTRCIRCRTVYSNAPNCGTSTMRRHLRRCFPQPLTQFSSEEPLMDTGRSENEARVSKKLRPVMYSNLHGKTDRELVEFIWMNKRNIGLLEEKLPDKAITMKEAVKCYEAELNRRAKLKHHKEKGPGHGTSIVEVKIEEDDQDFGHNMAIVPVEHSDLNQENSPDSGTSIVEVKSEADDPLGGTPMEHADVNQSSAQQTAISILPQDICTELKKVSSVLSMLNSPNINYTPKDNPLEKEAEQAKHDLIELLKKDFETIVCSPDAQKLISCVQILTKNLDKLPMFQGRVIESLNTEFETTCQNWATWHKSIQTNIAFELEQGDNLKFLKEWQEKDMELESEIAKVDLDILRLKAELREKELTRENLARQKCSLLDQSKISIDEAKKLLQEMVKTKLQSDVANDNMKDAAKKWERIRESFQVE